MNPTQELIKIVQGDLLKAKIKKDTPTFILHVVNNRGAWGAGFSGALSKKHPQAEQRFRQENLELRNIQTIGIHHNLHIINMCAQDGYGRTPNPSIRYISYSALRECIRKSIDQIRMISDQRVAYVYMPKVGAGLGGGNWRTVFSIIKEEFERANSGNLSNIKVFIFELENEPTNRRN